MRKSLKKAALTLFAVAALTAANAQKVAHLSLDSLVTLMPESKTAKDAAENYLNDLKKTSNAMQDELNTKYQDYLGKEATMSDLVRKTKQEELQSLQKRIEDFNQQAQMDYQQKYGELTKPLMDKAKKAIEAVAKENGYKYVLDTSIGNVLYSDQGEDILLTVKKKMDSMPLANIPGTEASKPAGTPKSGGTPKK